MASSRSNPSDSFAFEEISFWKMTKMGSIWLLATICSAARGIMEERRRTSAGTLPRELYMSRVRMGPSKLWKCGKNLEDVRLELLNVVGENFGKRFVESSLKLG